MLKRCRSCGGTVKITRTVDTSNNARWVIIGHGMMPCRCGKIVKMESRCFKTLSAADKAYDELIDRWNRERGMPDDGDRD